MAVAATAAQPALPTAMIAGANGLTGSALVRLMLRTGDYGRVLALTRRPLPIEHPRLANRILNYEELAASLVGASCNDAFCCLGAARGPQADIRQLQRVDLELTLAFGRAARAAGATRMVVISAAGAVRGASSAFLRTKAEMEAALKELKFPALDILQPAVVVGERAGGSALDSIRQVLAPLVNLALTGALQNARWITGADLAAAMLGAAGAQRRGVTAYGGKRLQQLTSAGAKRT